MKPGLKSYFLASLAMTSFLIAACSGIKTSTTGPGGGGTTFTIGGSVTGLTGTGLVLQDNAGDNLTVTASGPFTFKTAATKYAVTVLTQPSSPSQTCAVTGGTGTATANVTNVQVACSAASATIGGTVSGLSGSGLILQNNGGDSLTITKNGAFTFKTAITNGTYAVTVLTQPAAPNQICTVTNGSGNATANVTNVAVACVNSYTIGGNINGVVGAGMVLQDNGKDNLTITPSGASSTFTFKTQLPTGAKYAVTILTQPSSPAQSCVVTNGAGTATANVSNVLINCPAVTFSIGGTVVGLLGKQPVPPNNQPLTDNSFILLNNGGDNQTISQNGPFTFATPVNINGAYNVSIISSPSTQPNQPCTVWGFSGVATANVNNLTVDCGHDAWTWIGGSKTAGIAGTPQYGSFPTTPPTTIPNPYTNTPGARELGATWTDSSGNLWLFGGQGFELSGNTSPDTLYGLLSDLWVCPLATPPGPPTIDYCQWQLLEAVQSGHYPIAEHEGIPGFYGTQGVASANNLPGGRFGGATWVDHSGNLWLFGGEGIDSSSASPQPTEGMLNDLWSYNTSTGFWTWVGGSPNVNQMGVYTGTEQPGARWSSVYWTDKSGNFWLFGGLGYDGSGSIGFLNDLWEYTGGAWVFKAGSAVANTNGVYGAQGVAASSNAPGGRQTASAWVDASGNLWLFGGEGEDSVGTSNGVLNDLWVYNIAANQWTWVDGSNMANQDGVYSLGPLVGPADTTSAAGTAGLTGSTSGIFPGSRWGGTAWTDKNGNLWLFGGWGLDSTGTNGNGFLSDLWTYTPNTTASQPGTWTWVNGSNTGGQNGVYGSETRPYFTHNIWSPGGRRGTMSWSNTIFNQTHLWLLGGQGYDSTSSNGNGFLSDLWRYVPYP
jgi:hypothetical protein